MTTKTGTFSRGGTPYNYLEDSNGVSVAFGIDSADSDKIKISASASPNAVPSTGPQITIDPAANGDVTIDPNGSGTINAKATSVVTTGGVVQAAITTGALSASKGTNGQILIGSTAGNPSWAAITAGTGITVTNGANSITIAANGSTVVETITGNTGGAISPTAGNINLLTANSTVVFAGSGSTETLDFAPSLLALGSSLPSNTVSLRLTSVGTGASAANVSTADMTAFGYQALASNQNGTGNTALGSRALVTINNTVGNGHNTAVGEGAGFALTGGSFNTLIGSAVASNYTGSETGNVCINSDGVLGDSNTLRIGSRTAAQFTLSKAFIVGVDGVNVGSVAKVVTMASDQLGTATITAGSGIAVTPGANTITIATAGLAAFAWSVVSGTSQSAAVNNGYFTNNAGLVTVTLPSTAAIGDTIRISGLGAGGWRMAQNAGQSVNFSSVSTTVGVGGSLSSTARYDTIELVCCVANTTFNVVSSMGNITIV